jgi:hypothetical protein
MFWQNQESKKKYLVAKNLIEDLSLVLWDVTSKDPRLKPL